MHLSLPTEQEVSAACQRDQAASKWFKGLHKAQRQGAKALPSRFFRILDPSYGYPARLQGRQAPEWLGEEPIWSCRYSTSTRHQTTRNGPNRAIDGITGLVHAPCQPPFTAVVTGGTKSTIFWRYCRQNLPSRLGRRADFRPLSRRPTPSNSYFHGHGVGINGLGGLVD